MLTPKELALTAAKDPGELGAHGNGKGLGNAIGGPPRGSDITGRIGRTPHTGGGSDRPGG